ncbi:MAG: ATP-binding protein [Candidatus Saccharibacteria bacterium]|nr:ATP-binding protein [Candidatus Saccharibacteria bacterium]
MARQKQILVMANGECTKIALVGAGCSGKTSLLEALRSEMIGSNTIFLDEVAREYYLLHEGMSEEERYGFEAQAAIQQLCLERELAAHSRQPEAIVCDRSVLDVVVCLAAMGDLAGSDELFSRVATWIPSYTAIYLLDPSGIPFANDQVRREDPSVRDRLHQGFIDTFALKGVEYQLLDGDLASRTRIVAEML